MSRASELRSHRMYVATLGTAGGPKWWSQNNNPTPAGICTAVVVEGAAYLVDFGYGAGRQLREFGLSFGEVRGVFVTHLHSDHVVDLAGLILFGNLERLTANEQMVVLGPGNRGILPPLSPLAREEPELFARDCPTPGMVETFEGVARAFATDVNDRIFDYGGQPPLGRFAVGDISIPNDCGFHPNNNVAPAMDPFEVYRDERVVVSAILVDHHPTAPAFAYRFESAHGTVVVSGDTGFCPNVATIANGADVLLHEAINLPLAEAQMAASGMDPARGAAVMAHHKRAHTTPRDAGKIAALAEVEMLALHHLVPANSPVEAWYEAKESFDGTVLITEDLGVISVLE